MIKLFDHVVEPTIFPDGTSQVWKLPDEVLDEAKFGWGGVEIVWDFENDAEIFHVCQLVELLKSLGRGMHVWVRADFLPYGRQDKRVSNDSTFALSTLFKVLESVGVTGVTTIDAHMPEHDLPEICYSETPEGYIRHALSIAATGADTLCYPDSGAERRYAAMGLEWETPLNRPYFSGTYKYETERLGQIVLEKVRDQATGEITGLTFKKLPSGTPKSILIVDDICDGGRTFIESAGLLREAYPEADIHLYVSHGIFSKGTDVLFDAGIKTIHTIKGEVKRED